eukprot:946224-Prymnesium_polylepis.1
MARANRAPSPTLPAVAAQVVAFDVEFVGPCDYDYIEIGGTRYCGASGPYGVFSSYGQMTWTSDSMVTSPPAGRFASSRRRSLHRRSRCLPVHRRRPCRSRCRRRMSLTLAPTQPPAGPTGAETRPLPLLEARARRPPSTRQGRATATTQRQAFLACRAMSSRSRTTVRCAPRWAASPPSYSSITCTRTCTCTCSGRAQAQPVGGRNPRWGRSRAP